ncbi:MAG: hypothetical protein R3F49_18890 [Planctomycetota bacterium]
MESPPHSLSPVPDAQRAPIASASPVADLGWRATTRRLVASVRVALENPARLPAGFCYQFLALGWAFGIAAAVPVIVRLVSPTVAFDLGFTSLHSSTAFDALVRDGHWTVYGVGLLALSLRFAPGLARSFFLGEGQRPIAQTSKVGRGFGVSCAAIWVQIVVTMLAASTLTVLLVFLCMLFLGADPDGPLPKLGASLAVGFLFVYGATLGALYHLALASLVRHQRGAGSALLHAWRLVRSQPAGAARAVALEGALYAAVAYLEWVVPTMFRMGGIATLLVLALSGVTRAGFWSRTYHAFGGVEPVPPTGAASAA